MINTDELRQYYTGDELLLAAVLEQSLTDLFDPQERPNAWRYLINDSLDSPLSVGNICLQLELDLDIIRAKAKDAYYYGKPLHSIRTVNVKEKFPKAF